MRSSGIAGSRSPQRVLITSPGSGVNPIDVSTDTPPVGVEMRRREFVDKERRREGESG